jgi:dolichol-phosphate mannosyltransferase
MGNEPTNGVHQHDAQRNGSINSQSNPAAPFISVVIPARHEAPNVPVLIERLKSTLLPYTDQFELIFVCDGFEDQTCEIVRQHRLQDNRVKLLHLSRSFGHQNAILAGMDHAGGQIVVTMDADLQHPPEAITGMLEQWEAGYDVVHAIRRRGGRQNPLQRRCKDLAYFVLRKLCDVDIIPQSADFKLYDRAAAQAMRQLREQGRFNRGLASWVGFRHASVYYDEGCRAAGLPQYSLTKRWLLMLNGVFSLSSKPLQYLGVVGLGVSGLSGLYLVVIVAAWLLGWEDYHAVAGWASTVAIVLFVGGVQMTGLWLMGQYLARTYDEVKGRPCYIVAGADGLTIATGTGTSRCNRKLPRRAPSPAKIEAPHELHAVGYA